MQSLISAQFWLFFLLFLFSVVVSVVIPGFLILHKFKFKDNSTKVLIAFVLGVVMWSAQGYLFGYLSMRFLTYLYLLTSIFFAFKYRTHLLSAFYGTVTELKGVGRKIIVLISIGTLVQTLPVLGSGLRFGDGIKFYGVNGYDGVMHLGFIQSIINSFPPQEPGAVGNLITNYHYWSDLFFAELSRIWHLPISFTFFQYAPPLISIITAIALYKLLKSWSSNQNFLLCGLFFLYFGSDAAYIFMLTLHQRFGFYTPAIDNGIMQFLNMPHAMAKMIFFTGLLSMQYWITTKSRSLGLLTVVLLASLTGFKVYFAIYSLLGFGSLLLYLFLSEWFKANRKKLRYIPNAVASIRALMPTLIFTLVFFSLFLIIFLPPNKNSGGLFYSPLEWSKILLSSSAIDFKGWWYWYNRFTSSKNLIGVSALNAAAIIITLLAIHGTRVVGFFIGKSTYKSLGGVNTAFLIPPLIIFQILGLTTLQISGGLNVFNFFAVSTVILAIFSAFKLVEIYDKGGRLRVLLVVLILLLTLPRSIYEVYASIRGYIREDNAYTISNKELEALEFIRINAPADTIIQSHPDNHLDSSVPYVAYFTNKKTYLTGIKLQETHNQPIKERRQDLSDLFSAPNSFDFLKGLEKRKIGLFYFQKNLGDQAMPYALTEGHFKVFFENENIIVYDPIEGL